MVTKTLFPYVGEIILQKILEQRPDLILDAIGKKQLGGTVPIFTQIALRALEDINGSDKKLTFDPVSRIDLGMICSDEIIPIEVKLGETGLNVSNVKTWLEDCEPSHNETRVKGKMFAILERKFHNLRLGAPELYGYNDKSSFPVKETQTLPIARDWVLIARETVIRKWEAQRDKEKSFLANTTFISVESVCSAYGESNFNTLVGTLLQSQNYFDEWNLKMK